MPLPEWETTDDGAQSTCVLAEGMLACVVLRIEDKLYHGFVRGFEGVVGDANGPTLAVVQQATLRVARYFCEDVLDALAEVPR